MSSNSMSAFIRQRPSDVLPREEQSVLFPALRAMREFHKAYGHPVREVPTIPDRTRQLLRKALIDEEWKEAQEALAKNDLVGFADGIYDLLYVVLGTMVEYGLPAIGFDEVHWSNMTKLGEDGRPILRPDGKSLKGPNFKPPNLKTILEAYGWESGNF